MTTYIKTYDLSKVWPPTHALQFCMKNNFNRGLKADGYNDSSVIKQQLEECLKNDEGYLILSHSGGKYTGWGLAYKNNDVRPKQRLSMLRNAATADEKELALASLKRRVHLLVE